MLSRSEYFVALEAKPRLVVGIFAAFGRWPQMVPQAGLQQKEAKSLELYDRKDKDQSSAT